MKQILNFEKLDNVLDFLTWAAIISIFVWALAKGLGIINTPAIVEVYPLLAASFVVGRMFQEIESTKRTMRDFKTDFSDFKKINKNDLDEIKFEMKSHDKRLMAVEFKS